MICRPPGRGAPAGHAGPAIGAAHLVETIAAFRPVQAVKQRQELVRQEIQRLREQARHRLRERQDTLENLQDRLRLLGPTVLARATLLRWTDHRPVLRKAGRRERDSA